MEIYENYGISTYNLGQGSEEMQVSYYWLEEAYRLHNESLKTVVLNAYGFFKKQGNNTFRRALSLMKLSDVKLSAFWDLANGNLSDMISYVVPLFAYHERWEEISQTDFTKRQYYTKTYLRGYNFYLVQTNFTDKTYSKLSVPGACGQKPGPK